MTSTEQWFEQLDNLGLISVTDKDDQEYKDLITKIQLDAFKAGMTKAAKLALEYDRSMKAVDINNAILTARDNKTTLP